MRRQTRVPQKTHVRFVRRRSAQSTSLWRLFPALQNAEFGMSDTSEKVKPCFYHMPSCLICSSGSFVIVEEEEIRNGRISPVKWNHLENSLSLQSRLFEDRRSWKQCRRDVPPMTVCSSSSRASAARSASE